MMEKKKGGKLTHLGGKAKETAGELLGDRELEREGELDQVAGRAEQDEERAREALEDAEARRRAAERARET